MSALRTCLKSKKACLKIDLREKFFFALDKVIFLMYYINCKRLQMEIVVMGA